MQVWDHVGCAREGACRVYRCGSMLGVQVQGVGHSNTTGRQPSHVSQQAPSKEGMPRHS